MMEIQQDILRQHIHEAAVDQLIREYGQKGYELIREYKINDFHADVYAQKGNEKIIFEIKSGRWTKDKRDQVRKLRNYVDHELQAAFRLIMVNVPSKSKIEVEGIEDICKDLILDHCVDELNYLSTHTIVEEVVDIDYAMIKITPNYIEVEGSGDVVVTLQNDDDALRGDGEGELQMYPLHFHITMDKDRKIADVLNLAIDLDEGL